MILTSIPSPAQNVWYLGPLPLRAYALIIILGMLVGAWVVNKRYAKKGGPAGTVADVALWAILFGIVGARIYHIFSTPGPYFGKNGDLSKIFRIWEGGLGIWGAIAFGAIGLFIALHKKGLRFAPFVDAIAPGLLIGQAIGRFGNYFNQELYGRPTDLPWALEISPEHIVNGYPVGTTFHPTFLYEALWCALGAIFLIYMEQKFKIMGGKLALLYIMTYTLGRVWIEYLRIDEAEIVWGLRLNVWTSIFVFAGACVAYILLDRYLKNHLELNNIYLLDNSAE